tara:strand:- start:426 stop:2666 length:2241 start_codon:yes stop_codon:yes gene_type:complete
MTQTLEQPITLKIPMEIPDSLYQLNDILTTSGHEMYIAGGAVRDTILGKTPKDYDIATSASPEQVIQRLGPYVERAEVQGEASFAVARLIAYDGNEYEFAPYRIDRGTRSGGDAITSTKERPLSIRDDVMRRDLTINALFYRIPTRAEREQGIPGEAVDFVGGIEDIKNEIVRTVGDPEERFAEDRLRILRAFRFAGRVGGEISAETADAIRANNSLTEPSDAAVSLERIQDEVKKGIWSSKSPSHYINMLQDFGLFSQVLPGLNISRAISSSRNIAVQLATILKENNPREAARVLMDRKFGSKVKDAVKFLLELSSLGRDNLVELKKELSRIRKSAGTTLGDDDIMDFGVIIGKDFSKFLDFSSAPPVVSARDLIAGGMKPGPDLGVALRDAEISAYFEDSAEDAEDIDISLKTESSLKTLIKYLKINNFNKEARMIDQMLLKKGALGSVEESLSQPIPEVSGDVYVFDMDDTLFWSPEWHSSISTNENNEATSTHEGVDMLFEGTINLVNAINVDPNNFIRKNKDGSPNIELQRQYLDEIGEIKLISRNFDMPMLGKENQTVFVVSDKNDNPISIDAFKKFFPSKHQKRFDLRGKYVNGIAVVAGDAKFYKDHKTLGWNPNNEILDIYKSNSQNSIILTARETAPMMEDGIKDRLKSVGAQMPIAIFTKPEGHSGGKYKGHVLGLLAEQSAVSSVVFYDDNLRYIDQAKDVLLNYYGSNVAEKVKINLVSIDRKPKNINIERPN